MPSVLPPLPPQSTARSIKFVQVVLIRTLSRYQSQFCKSNQNKAFNSGLWLNWPLTRQKGVLLYVHTYNRVLLARKLSESRAWNEIAAPSSLWPNRIQILTPMYNNNINQLSCRHKCTFKVSSNDGINFVMPFDTKQVSWARLQQ